MKAPEGRAGPPRIVYVYLAIIVVSWAGNWPLMKLAIADAPPLVLVLFWVGQFQVTGFLLFAILGLAIEAPGRAIVLAYTFSLWAVPIGILLGVERLGRLHLIGAAIGFAGLVLFMNPGLVDWTSARTLLGNAFLLLAAIAWAFGSCLYRRRIWRTGFWAQTFWQLAVSTPVVAAVVLGEAMDQAIHWSAALVLVLA